MRLPSFPPFDRYPPQFVSVNRHRTAYIRHGQGPPAVLLHGYAGAIWNWERQIEPLGERFTLFIPDVIGQGLSDKPRVAYRPAFYAGWLRGFLDAVGLARAPLVGHSMGAGLALGLALVAVNRDRVHVVATQLLDEPIGSVFERREVADEFYRVTDWTPSEPR